VSCCRERVQQPTEDPLAQLVGGRQWWCKYRGRRIWCSTWRRLLLLLLRWHGGSRGCSTTCRDTGCGAGFRMGRPALLQRERRCAILAQQARRLLSDTSGAFTIYYYYYQGSYANLVWFIYNVFGGIDSTASHSLNFF
jgi:hypothetical protein